MSGASSLASVAQQMAMGMGVAVGAAGLHLAAALRGGGPLVLADFHVAFVLIGVFTLAGLPTFVRMPVEAEGGGERAPGVTSVAWRAPHRTEALQGLHASLPIAESEDAPESILAPVRLAGGLSLRTG